VCAKPRSQGDTINQKPNSRFERASHAANDKSAIDARTAIAAETVQMSTLASGVPNPKIHGDTSKNNDNPKM